MPYDDSLLAWLADRAGIVDCVTRFANAFDANDWRALRACLTDVVETDYSQFRGIAPAAISADDYVAARAAGIANLRTLHIITNHEVSVEGERARCRSVYRIYRRRDAADGREDRLDTAGHYEHKLVRTDAGWRIDGIRQTVVFMDGDPAIHGACRAPNVDPGEPR